MRSGLGLHLVASDDPPEEVAKWLRALAAGLTNPADIAAVNRYADELEQGAKAQRAKSKKDKKQD